MDDLSDFFNLVAEEKRKKETEFHSLIGEDFFGDNFIENLITSSKKPLSISKKKKRKTKSCVENKEIVLENTDYNIVEKSLGLLAEPTEIKQQQDPLTPIDKKIEDLEKQYKLFLSRIQQQLSTLGGGGETNLAFMDMPVKYVTSSSYTITPQDYYIGVNYAGAVTITLPTPRKNGKIYVVKDELGEASNGTNRYITILPSGSDTIDGQDKAILAYDFGSLTFVYRDSWRII